MGSDHWQDWHDDVHQRSTFSFDGWRRVALVGNGMISFFDDSISALIWPEEAIAPNPLSVRAQKGEFVRSLNEMLGMI
jgi:hypothetical protein